MRAVVIFAAGLLLGAAMRSVAAQEGRIPGAHLNHVMIRVPDLEQARTFYKDTFGFTEAFAVTPEDGSASYVYLQISKDTFLELMPASPKDPPGLGHFGLQVDDARRTVNRMKQHGLQVNDPTVTRTKAVLSHVQTSPGVSVEIAEYSRPDSLVRNAINAWR